jgi:hypothetical protein
MERTKSIPQQQAWVTTHKKRIIKHLDQLIGELIREREAIALTLSGTRKAVGSHQKYWAASGSKRRKSGALSPRQQ